MPTLGEHQQVVDQWIQQFEEGYWPPLSMLAAITEEVGEVARVVNALEGHKPTKQSQTKDQMLVLLGEELGDLLFAIICLANDCKVDLDESLHRTLAKYNVRDLDRWTLKEDIDR